MQKTMACAKCMNHAPGKRRECPMAPRGGRSKFDLADLVRHSKWDTCRLQRRAAEIFASHVTQDAGTFQCKQSSNHSPSHATTADGEDANHDLDASFCTCDKDDQDSNNVDVVSDDAYARGKSDANKIMTSYESNHVDQDLSCDKCHYKTKMPRDNESGLKESAICINRGFLCGCPEQGPPTTLSWAAGPAPLARVSTQRRPLTKITTQCS